MQLSTLKKNKPISFQLNGIKYKIILVGRYKEVIRILIENCPKCGKEGYLIAQGRSGSGNRFGIKHDNNTTCFFGWTSKEWDILNEIYKSVRR